MSRCTKGCGWPRPQKDGTIIDLSNERGQLARQKINICEVIRNSEVEEERRVRINK